MNKAIKRYWPIFLLPTMAAFLIGFIVPFIEGIYLSFCDFTTIKDATFVDAFKFTTLFAIVVLVLINVLAFLVALALTQKMKGTNIFRMVFFLLVVVIGLLQLKFTKDKEVQQ